MGSFVSKEWAEVMTAGSPEVQPESDVNVAAQEGKGSEPIIKDKHLPKNRILSFDPRSESDNVDRTPIRVNKESNKKAKNSE